MSKDSDPDIWDSLVFFSGTPWWGDHEFTKQFIAMGEGVQECSSTLTPPSRATLARGIYTLQKRKQQRKSLTIYSQTRIYNLRVVPEAVGLLVLPGADLGGVSPLLNLNARIGGICVKFVHDSSFDDGRDLGGNWGSSRPSITRPCLKNAEKSSFRGRWKYHYGAQVLSPGSMQKGEAGDKSYLQSWLSIYCFTLHRRDV